MSEPTNAQPGAPAAVPFLSCSECNSPIRTHYYALNERPVCGKCRTPYARLIQRTDGPGAVWRVGIQGAVVAVIGALVVAMVAGVFPAARMFVIAPLGYLIGKRMMKSLEEYSARRYQYIAVSLTYVALLAGLWVGANRHAGDTAERRAEVATKMQGTAATQQTEIDAALDDIAVDDEEDTDPADSTAEAAAEEPPPTAAHPPEGPGPGLAIVLLLLFPLFTMLQFGMAFSAIGVFALGFSLYQAWKQTDGQGRHLEILGPFKVGEGPIAAR